MTFHIFSFSSDFPAEKNFLPKTTRENQSAAKAKLLKFSSSIECLQTFRVKFNLKDGSVGCCRSRPQHARISPQNLATSPNPWGVRKSGPRWENFPCAFNLSCCVVDFIFSHLRSVVEGNKTRRIFLVRLLFLLKKRKFCFCCFPAPPPPHCFVVVLFSPSFFYCCSVVFSFFTSSLRHNKKFVN